MLPGRGGSCYQEEAFIHQSRAESGLLDAAGSGKDIQNKGDLSPPLSISFSLTPSFPQLLSHLSFFFILMFLPLSLKKIKFLPNSLSA